MCFIQSQFEGEVQSCFAVDYTILDTNIVFNFVSIILGILMIGNNL